jgi:LysR family transcriptional activator of nhaA
MMNWLNYHHLQYFWTVAREGSVSAAARSLRIAQPTVSTQVKQLEEQLGERLFERSGRGLVLTEAGRVVFGYADEIFGLGRELVDTLRGRPTGRPLRLSVGIADVVPKLVAWRLLEPVLALPDAVRLVCHEDRHDRLLAAMALYELDLVITDTPLGPGTRVKAFNHPLGESGVTFIGTRALSALDPRPFPECLRDAPMLLPTENTTLRRGLDLFFEQLGLRPRVVGEFEDSALLKLVGEHGAGLFAVPTVIEDAVLSHPSLVVVGRTDAVRERFFAISPERRLKHPAVVAISQRAREIAGG